ncbi:MAG TPA: 16S rRNA (guanine(527)-N(7))-methyltransferase RsmG [Steroidobacteraceae bacterium]|nr:16S rRNA (guanine(527)-N(7))-methyltransferase RsmG [Steroidobacteraceae bacterium]
MTAPEQRDGAQRAREAATLLAGARALGVPVADPDAERLLRLLDELTLWNRAYSLTAVSSRAEMLTHHLLDSLAVAPYLAVPPSQARAPDLAMARDPTMAPAARVADVGTGAGFPGLPLAVVRPDLHFTLIDSAGKKLRFVAHAARVLGLANVQTVQARMEDLKPDPPFDTVVARACAALPQLLTLVAPLTGPDTRVLAMKGRYPDSEIKDVRPPWRVIETVALGVPGLNEARHLVIVNCRLPP